jgi:hypothetical protein
MKMVGKPQGNHNICGVKESGESKRQQNESSEETTEKYITRWTGANALI